MRQKITLLTRTMLLLCALVAGSGSVWADDETTVATFSSEDAVTNTSYSDSYGGDDWYISKGGNNKSIGFNNSNCTAIGDNLGTGATAANYGVVVKSKNKLSNVNKITFVYTGGSGDGGKIYLASSANGTDWSPIVMSVGSTAQGTTVSKNTTLTFEFSTISSAYYGIILDSGAKNTAAYRFDYVTINFINVPASSSAAEKPTFDPTSCELTKAQNVTVSSTGAAKIIYTTNGDEPTIGGATTTTVNAATASVLVNGDMTIKAKGVDSSNELSQLSSASYTINLAEPEILPAERTYTETTNVSFTQDDDIDVYYTLDGSDPTASSTKYDGTPFAITENLTIKAIAIDEYGNESEVVEAKFKNSALQNTEITISNWNTLFGTSFTGSLSGTNLKDYNGTIDNLSVVYGKGSASNMYIKNDDLRIYNGNKMIFTAPAGYGITKIEFTGTSSSDKAPLANFGTFDYSKKVWTGNASTVILFRTSGSGYTKFESAKITLAAAPATLSKEVTSAGWATYTPTYPVSFGDDEAYIITAASESATTLTEVSSVPAGTPVLLKGAGYHTLTVVGTSSTNVSNNCLKVSDGTAKNNIYVLANGNYGVGFYVWTGENALSVGKIYMQIPTSSSREFISLEESTTTGVNDVRSKKAEVREDVYNLNGQRVEKPTKGLYIVNGKKVIIK